MKMPQILPRVILAPEGRENQGQNQGLRVQGQNQGQRALNPSNDPKKVKSLEVNQIAPSK